MNYKQHHKEVTVDLHKIINRLIYMYTLWIFYRTTTNVPRRNNQNDEGANGDTDAGGAGGGAGGDNQQGQNDPNTNAHNYDAHTSKNQSRSAVKLREEIQMFQQKVLKTLEQPHPAEPTEPEEYVDLALAAISRKMKDTLSKNEIMDLVEDIQQIVNRACREKREVDGTGNSESTCTTTSYSTYQYRHNVWGTRTTWTFGSASPTRLHS